MRRPGHTFSPRWLLVLGVLVTLVFQAPRPAEAIFGFGDTSVTVADIPRQIGDAISAGLQKLKENIKIANDIAFKNSVKLFASRILKETSTQLATAGPVGRR